MKKKLNLRIVVSLFFIVCALSIGVAVFATIGQSDVKKLHVENETDSLIVYSIKELERIGENSRLAITVKNVSEKPILAYSIGISDNKTNKNSVNRIEINGAINNWFLKSNDINVTPFSVSSEGERTLTIAAVMFEDGSGEGISTDLSRLQEVRAGAMLAVKQITSILKSIGQDKNHALDSTIESTKEKIASLNENDVSENLRRGFVQAKDYYASELKDLKDKALANSNFNLNAEITKKVAKMERTLAKQ
ncbi:MAG TPA: hypothetical protein VF648_07930 [Pyrinomonadaceae bacterium]